ncbi:class II glutamine amidotransferase [Methylococcus capsulatus]|uniref:class II glutamine amidotransferase n=1 Tax=Methylococcus capsulatus TaxID=414 RepID=UPI002016FD97|nr:class II glutamine amidotransferase [Methylococcus capsulatus]UQN12123.1 class II glutamine amidotransferase [Methylococcus capsulatus]
MVCRHPGRLVAMIVSLRIRSGAGKPHMCRLYGFRATEPTKVECALVHAQNALMVQSRRDREGLRHGHGWGVATYENRLPHVERQAWAAYHSERFRRAAASVRACTVIAHVRHATVGRPLLENTHPFTHGCWTFAHNGTIPRFSEIMLPMLEAMTSEHRAAIGGSTDSEHIFHLLLSMHEAEPDRPLLDIVRDGARRIMAWCEEFPSHRGLGLNVLLTDGDRFVGTRLGRTLYYVEREGLLDCEICGFPHIDHTPGNPYFAVVVASEPLSHEAWREIPEGSVYEITPDMRVHVEDIGAVD